MHQVGPGYPPRPHPAPSPPPPPPGSADFELLFPTELRLGGESAAGATCLGWGGPHDSWSAVVRDHQGALEEHGCLATWAQGAVTHPQYFPWPPPPRPRSGGQPMTHPAGRSRESPLPRAGPARSLPAGGAPTPSLSVDFSLSLCLLGSFYLCLSLSSSVFLSISVCLPLCLSCSVSPCLPSSPQNLCSPFPASPRLASIFRHLLVWGECSGQRWQEPRAEAGGLGGAGGAGGSPPSPDL